MAMTDDEARGYFRDILFDVAAARAGDLVAAFIWAPTKQGGEFWESETVKPTKKGRAILAAMVKEYERLQAAQEVNA